VTAHDSQALNRLGHDALIAGDPDRAIAIFAQAILLDPRDPYTHVNMAAAYLALDRLGEARSHAQRAVRLAPLMPEAHHNLGNAQFAAGDADAALTSFAAARSLDLDNEAHWTNFLFAQTFAERSSESQIGRSAIFAENKAWGERIEHRIGARARPEIADRDADRTLKLAYVLPEFDAHVTARFLAPILAAHDAAHFQVSVYGYRSAGGPPPSPLTPPGVRWVDVRGRSDAALAQLMKSDGIDVLIHPCTFKARYRTILAERAAPLQMAGINFLSTTGLVATDYLLSDAMLTPPSSEKFFTEQLAILPVFNCYGAPDYAPDVEPLPALAAGFITFGSFNNPAKLGAASLDLWSAVLARVPASRLLLKHRAFDDAAVREDFQRRFAGHGIAAERIVFAGFTSDPRSYLTAYHGIDIALDTTPFNGGTTSYEAIWMGVPVLTLAGDRLMGRQTASLMNAIGHPDFVTDSKQAFVDKGFALSQAVNALGEVRAGLRGRAAATIFDAVRYTRTLEDAVRIAWRDLCRGIDGSG
jgi:protein O-GlcNAc transferase